MLNGRSCWIRNPRMLKPLLSLELLLRHKPRLPHKSIRNPTFEAKPLVVLFENCLGVAARKVIVPSSEDVNDGARSFSRGGTNCMVMFSDPVITRDCCLS